MAPTMVAADRASHSTKFMFPRSKCTNSMAGLSLALTRPKICIGRKKAIPKVKTAHPHPMPCPLVEGSSSCRNQSVEARLLRTEAGTVHRILTFARAASPV
jgi:hypothetical protein